MPDKPQTGALPIGGVLSVVVLAGFLLYAGILWPFRSAGTKLPVTELSASEGEGQVGLDPAIIGVITGSLLSLAGNVVNHCVAARKERALWDRQQEKEERDRARAERLASRDRLLDVYWSCIRDLGLLAAIDRKQTPTGESKRLEVIQAIHNSLTMLCLYHKEVYEDETSAFRRGHDAFVRRPNGDEAVLLRGAIMGLALEDRARYIDRGEGDDSS